MYCSRIFLVTFCVFTLNSCATDGVGRYRVQSVGNAQRSVEAIVLQAAPVYIQDQTSGAGAALGATVGGGVAADSSDDAAVIIAGIITGAIIGDYVEGMSNIYDATEYVIRTSNGALLTVAQVNLGNELFKTDDNVILLYGYPTRLIRDRRN